MRKISQQESEESMAKPTVAILGASTDRKKFGNKSVRAHQRAGYEVYPINPKADEIETLKAYPSLADIPAGKLDRVSVYLPPQVGLTMVEAMRAANPSEVWFNPGSENSELLAKARDAGLNVIADCSIVDVGFSPRDFPD